MATPITDLRGPSRIPQSNYSSRVLGWASEAIQESEAFLKAQPGYTKIAESIRFIMGQFSEAPGRLSQTVDNHFAKQATVLVSLLTDIKPFWEYRTHNERYQKSAELMGKVTSHWWINRKIDMRHADVVRYGAVAGTGFAHMTGWNREAQDLDMVAEDPRDVLPVRPSSMHTIQDAFGVIVRRERTVNYVQALYPESAHLITPDRDGSFTHPPGYQTRAGRILQAINDQLSPFHAHLQASDRPAAHLGKVPVVDLFTLYVKDNSRNRTRADVLMGDPHQNWSYTVRRGDLLYPRKRLIIFTRKTVLYDGPSIFWHGMFPICKLTLDPWPWTWLGKGPLWDALPLQKSLNRHLRIVDDHHERVAQPGSVLDKNAVSRHLRDKLNTRYPGMKLSHNPIMGKAVEIIHEPPLDPSVREHISHLYERIDEHVGTRDLLSLMKLGQLPSKDTIDKIVEAMTPLNRQRSRSMEAFMREFALMSASNVMQYYTEPMRIALLGSEGQTLEDFDYDPGTLVPDFVHPEDFDATGNVLLQARQRGPRPRADRAQYFLSHFTYRIAPGSLLNAASIERKLLFLQLARAGLVDHWTLLETLEVPNVGEAPAGTITERLQAEAEMGLGMNISSVGRKATAQAMPRTVVKES